MSIKAFLPEDPNDVLALEPEELAECVLGYFVSRPESERERLMNRYSFGLPHTVSDYPTEFHDRLCRALMEAWMSLERDMLVAPRPGAGPGSEWYFVTQRGIRLAESGAYEEFRAARLLPRELLHPVIAARVWPDFLRKDYDSAVFKAFKEVEVAVREAGGYTSRLYGVELIREAFHTNKGHLTDQDADPGERDAVSHLFAGAIGLFKNPTSHRHLGLEDPAAVVEMIMLASHLMRIIDERRGVAKERTREEDHGP